MMTGQRIVQGDTRTRGLRSERRCLDANRQPAIGTSLGLPGQRLRILWNRPRLASDPVQPLWILLALRAFALVGGANRRLRTG